MTSFNVHLHYYIKDKLEKYYSIACFAGCKLHTTKEIFLSRFRHKETEKYIPKLISIINEITPCKLVEIENVEYISFKMFNNYDRSLILLSFIRNLWWKQPGFDYKVFFDYISNNEYKDPMELLTEANKEACSDLMFNDHSNCHNKRDLKVKTVKQLKKAFKENEASLINTKTFLTRN